MSENTEMILEGVLCQVCGVYLGGDVGYPRTCDDCRNPEKKVKPSHEQSYMSRLSECIQDDFGESMKSRVVSKEGPEHEPAVFVEIRFPDGQKFSGKGKSKKIAKNSLAEKLLREIYPEQFEGGEE